MTTSQADIVERLRAMSRCEHDDLSIGDEAADEIERLREALKALNLAYMGVPFSPTAEQLQAMQVASEMARAATARKP